MINKQFIRRTDELNLNEIALIISINSTVDVYNNINIASNRIQSG